MNVEHYKGSLFGGRKLCLFQLNFRPEKFVSLVVYDDVVDLVRTC